MSKPKLTVNIVENFNTNSILIPEDTIIEGFIKTKKSFRIKSNFYGTLLSLEKITIDESSSVVGDIICSDLVVSGKFEGNIFCTGKLTVIGNSIIKGQVFTKLFQNESDCDLNCFIQIPNNSVINSIHDVLMNMDASTKLSIDENLRKIIKLFQNNVFSGNTGNFESNSHLPQYEPGLAED